MPKKVLIALPPKMLEKVDFISESEHRTRSDLIRESLRRYIEEFETKRQAIRGTYNLDALINEGESHDCVNA